jgi:aconitate hydratase
MLLMTPTDTAEARATLLEKTSNITTLPDFGRFSGDVVAPVLLKTGPDISTDDIIPAGTRVMPYWSNIPKVAEFTFEGIDNTYPARAKAVRDRGQRHAIIAGANYGQGSSREHAAIAPRYLGAEVVIAQSFARIHWQNLVNFGVLPLTFANPSDYDRLQPGDTIRITDVAAALKGSREITAAVDDSQETITLRHNLSERQIAILLAGGAINWREDSRPDDQSGTAPTNTPNRSDQHKEGTP